VPECRDDHCRLLADGVGHGNKANDPIRLGRDQHGCLALSLQHLHVGQDSGRHGKPCLLHQRAVAHKDADPVLQNGPQTPSRYGLVLLRAGG